MQWYDNPAFQSALAPILLASIVLVATQRYRVWSEPLTVLGCFLLATYLVIGINISPLTSTNKIVLLAIGSFILGFAFHFLKLRSALLLPIAVSFGIAFAYWVIWPWMTRQEWLSIIISASAVAAFIIANGAGLAKATHNRKKFLAIAAVFSLSISLCSIIGASALLGQLSMAIAMPFFVAFALNWFRPFEQSNMNFLLLSFGLPISLLAISACVYASVPWFVLIVLSLIPLSSYFSLPNNLDKRYKLAAEIAVSVVPGLSAILLTWNSAGSVPF